jgi:hypothetical protein
MKSKETDKILFFLSAHQKKLIIFIEIKIKKLI